MAKKQSPPPPNPHSPHKASQNPNPNLMGKKQASPPLNPAKKQASPPLNPNPNPNPSLMAKKQPPPPPNPYPMAKNKPYLPPNPTQMGKKQPSPPPPKNPNVMAKKQPPPSSSSEDDSSSSASNNEEAIIKKPNAQITPTNNQEKQDEETGYETGYETSDDEEGEEVNQPETKTPQPIPTAAATPTLKPCDASEKPKGKDGANNGDEESESDSRRSDEDEEPLSKPQAAISMTAATPALKPCDGGEKPNGKGDASRKNSFQRIWTLEDEIGILKAMPKFEAEHGPVKINRTGIRPFHDFVRDSLSLEVSDSQFYEKVRRLMRKYKSRANRGTTIRFRSAHDEEVHELSKKIWGTGSRDNIAAKIAAKSKRAATLPGNDGTGSGSLKRKYPFFSVAMATSIPEELLEMVVDPETARLLEVKFMKQMVAEIKEKRCKLKLKKKALDKVLEDIEMAMRRRRGELGN